MEPLHDIFINLLSDSIWALGGFLIAYIIKKATDLHGRGNETIVTCCNKKKFVIAARATVEKNNFSA